MRVFLFCFLILSSLDLQAQYQSLFGGTSTDWRVKTEQLFGAVADSTVYVKDSVIGGMDFKWCAVYRESSFMLNVLVHEDVNTGYAFFRIAGQTTDYLIYDLNLALNDQLFYNGQTITVDSVFLLDGRKHIRFDFEINFMDHLPLTWIEGVGANVGLLYHDQAAIANLNPVLICQHQDGGVNWTTKIPEYEGQCRSDIGGLSENDDSALISIYPQPAHDLLNIMFPPDLNLNLIGLFDLNGRLMPIISMVSSSSLSLTNLNSGCYFLIFESNGRPIVKKVIFN